MNKEAYRKPKKASRKPQGSYKKFQGRNPEIISFVFWKKLSLLTDLYLQFQNVHICLIHVRSNTNLVKIIVDFFEIGFTMAWIFLKVCLPSQSRHLIFVNFTHFLIGLNNWHRSPHLVNFGEKYFLFIWKPLNFQFFLIRNLAVAGSLVETKYQNLHWKLGLLTPSFGSTLKNVFLRNKTFFVFQDSKHLFEIEFHETSQNFNSIRQQIEKLKITIVWMKFCEVSWNSIIKRWKCQLLS